MVESYSKFLEKKLNNLKIKFPDKELTLKEIESSLYDVSQTDLYKKSEDLRKDWKKFSKYYAHFLRFIFEKKYERTKKGELKVSDHKYSDKDLKELFEDYMFLFSKKDGKVVMKKDKVLIQNINLNNYHLFQMKLVYYLEKKSLFSKGYKIFNLEGIQETDFTFEISEKFIKRVDFNGTGVRIDVNSFEKEETFKNRVSNSIQALLIFLFSYEYAYESV